MSFIYSPVIPGESDTTSEGYVKLALKCNHAFLIWIQIKRVIFVYWVTS